MVLELYARKLTTYENKMRNGNKTSTRSRTEAGGTTPGTSENQQAAKWHLCLPLLCCLCAVVVTLLAINCVRFLFSGTFGIQHSEWPAILIAGSASLGFMLAMEALQRCCIIVRSVVYQITLLRVIQLFFILCFVVAVVNLSFQLTHFLNYGDWGFLADQMINDKICPKWFLGSAILNKIYHHLWMNLNTYLPNAIANANEFIRISGAAIMAFSSIALLQIIGARLIIIFPLFTPIWLMFCSGYDEYYPFISGIYIAGLYLLSKGVDKYSPITVAAIASILMLSYVPFIPLGLIILLFYLSFAKFPDFMKALTLTCAICLLALTLLWPDTLMSLMNQYLQSLNLGEQNIGQYEGKSACTYSPFFKASYALSMTHAKELLFLLFWGGSFMPLILLITAASSCFKRGILSMILRNRAFIFVGMYFALQVIYFVFMIPKSGLTRDIDLFFTFHLMIGFAGGLLSDKLLDTFPVYWHNLIQCCLIGMLAGSSSVMLAYMLNIGIVP